jgi:hypothetical protein
MRSADRLEYCVARGDAAFRQVSRYLLFSLMLKLTVILRRIAYHFVTVPSGVLSACSLYTWTDFLSRANHPGLQAV